MLFFILIIIITISFSVKSQSFPLVTASNYLGNGFDYKTGTYALAPIFLFTYELNQTWTTPYSKKIYSVPDQMSLHSLDETFESIVESMSTSYEEFYENFIKNYYFTAGIDSGKLGFGFKYDKQMGFIKESLEESFVEFVHGIHYWAYNIAVMYPAFMLKLNPMFDIAIDKFPQKIISQKDLEYATEFVQTFGEFYVYRSIFGARLDFNSAISEKIISSYDKQWIVTQAGLSFHYYLFNVSGGGFSNQSQIHIDKEFILQTKANVTFYGGDPTLTDINKLSIWVDSIDQNLFPLNSTFVPIWTLVNDAIKSETMKNFMLEYLN